LIPSLPIDNWTVVVWIDPDNRFFAGPTSDLVVVTVYQPSLERFVTGGGWVHDPVI
jgi:hypothetical protein